ncbi:hypothetical protein DVH24_010741 [Malus domestica]|uniref:Uncharacterized protein n=1 Tax=Malus domestica TaxID=3750 RepID=A0A498JTP1_MALDO|nr:hypothetical protein DVH24_010741 [Malus domestica]
MCASEVFYDRRSCYNSRTATNLGFDSLPPPPTVASHNLNHSRCHHTYLPERATIGLKQGGIHQGSGNRVARSSGTLSGSERLPGSVCSPGKGCWRG